MVHRGLARNVSAHSCGLVALLVAISTTGHATPASTAGADDIPADSDAADALARRVLNGPDLQQWLSQQPAEPPVLRYVHGKVTLQGAPRLSRIPTADESRQIEDALAGKGKMPSVVKQQLKGIFIVAVTREEQSDDGRRFLHTADGLYLRRKDVKLLTPPAMHGELLTGATKLPMAFVYGEDRPVYRWVASELVDDQVARNHSRFPVKRTFVHQGSRYVEGPDGIVVPADALRIVDQIKRPTEIPDGAKWIHVDLSQQSLVAYEGDKPVFVTLVSGGREGHEAPTGLYRVRTKYVETTMDGPDPDEGWYEVQQVPWTMYYHRGYALHGAYWHDIFGQQKSHGCTNIAPADARWLFTWSDPKLPDGWKGLAKAGSYVYVTK